VVPVRTVSRLVEDLGPALVVGAAGDLSGELSAVVVSDPAHPVAMSADVLVVAVGHRLEDTAELVQQAASAGAPAVLLKGTSVPDTSPDGPAVVVVDPAADWGHVLTLARLSLNATSVVSPKEDESLFAVADALASLCHGSVVVHDPGWQLVAYSGGEASDQVRTDTLLGRRAPVEALARLREGGLLDRLQKGEHLHIEAGEIEGMGERYAAAILAGGQLFGTIWVTPSGESDEAETFAGLRRAVDVAALAMLRHAAVGGARADQHDAVFAALLNGMHTERLVAEHLKVRLDHGFVLAGLRPLVTEPADRAATARRLVSLARSYCDAYRVPAVTAPAHDATFLLFPCAQPEEREAVLRVLTDMHGRLQRSAPHRAMVSSSYPQLAETAAVRAVVEELLDLSERRGWSGLTDSDTVQASWRLAQFREVALAHPALLEGPGMRLVEHDREHGGELLLTLRAYFAAVGDVRLAASQLGLHYNTVRYRLRKAQEVARLDLDDPDQRLLAELQVRLLAD
jgi:hypothetical protein